MPRKSKELAALLKNLKTDYLSSLPEKIERIRKLTEASDWPKIADEYHKLKGTGKTYGFPEISVVAEKMENLALKKETQKKALFMEVLNMLFEMHQAYSKGDEFDLSQHALAKTLSRSGRRK